MKKSTENLKIDIDVHAEALPAKINTASKLKELKAEVKEPEAQNSKVAENARSAIKYFRSNMVPTEVADEYKHFFQDGSYFILKHRKITPTTSFDNESNTIEFQLAKRFHESEKAIMRKYGGNYYQDTNWTSNSESMNTNFFCDLYAVGSVFEKQGLGTFIDESMGPKNLEELEKIFNEFFYIVKEYRTVDEINDNTIKYKTSTIDQITRNTLGNLREHDVIAFGYKTKDGEINYHFGRLEKKDKDFWIVSKNGEASLIFAPLEGILELYRNSFINKSPNDVFIKIYRLDIIKMAGKNNMIK